MITQLLRHDDSNEAISGINELSSPPVHFDALCVFGRGIERVTTCSGAVWRPTRMIEMPTDQGKHTGWRRPASLETPGAIIAGGHANVLAGVELFRRAADAESAPQLVVFAAGRAKYLEEEPLELSEGSVYAEEFRRRTEPRSAGVDIIVVRDNRNTRDDAASFLHHARQRGMRNLAVITVQVHLERTAEFFRQLEPNAKTRLALIAAEDVLAQRYQHRDRFHAEHEAIRASDAYERTAAMEAIGLAKLRSGTYELR